MVNGEWNKLYSLFTIHRSLEQGSSNKDKGWIMAIEGFNYKEFAETLSSQASELLPDYFEEFQKNYVTNTIKNFATLSGEAIYNDDKANFTVDQGMLVTQIIAEWSFHKSVDIIKAGILPDYWDGIMQKLAFTIFEIAKQTILQGLPQDEILQIVEHHVKKTYASVLTDLKDRNVIDQKVLDIALHQSNIDDMMQKIQEDNETVARETEIEQANHQSNSKILKLASVALLLRQFPKDKVNVILSRVNADDYKSIMQYMQMSDLESKVDKNITMRCLQEIKTNLPEARYIKPEKILLKINKIFEKTPKVKIDLVVSKERPKVKEFIEKARGGEFLEIPPKIANIIVQHLEESVL